MAPRIRPATGERDRHLRDVTVAALFVLMAVQPLTVPLAAGEGISPGCRLEADDPLRVEVDQMMKDGAEFQATQTQALREKVTRLAQSRGWDSTEQEAYFRAVVLRGNQESWDQTLEVAAAFMRVCHVQDDGQQRAEAVRLFRQLYVVEQEQWRRIHDAVDRDIDAVEQRPEN